MKKEISKAGNSRLKENFWVTVGLTILFGISWAFGMLATAGLPDYIRIPFDIIFTVLASIQGVLVFLLYCIKSPECRELWKNWMLCRFTKMSKLQKSPHHMKPKSKGVSWGTKKGSKYLNLGKITLSQSQCNPSSGENKTLSSVNISSSVLSPPPNSTVSIELAQYINQGAVTGDDERCLKDDFTERMSFYDKYSVNSYYFGLETNKEGNESGVFEHSEHEAILREGIDDDKTVNV